MNLVMHIDGSRREVPRGTFTSHPTWMNALGWGIVALTKDTTIELSGAVPAPTKANGCHETLALVEAVRFIKQMQVPWQDVTIFTDDELVAYAAQALHPDNFRQSEAERVLFRLEQACQVAGEDLMADALVCLTTSRFIKMKGHRLSVYHNRADYLASQATMAATGIPAPIQSYDDWLGKGFQYYTSKGEPKRWMAPFSKKSTAKEPVSST